MLNRDINLDGLIAKLQADENNVVKLKAYLLSVLSTARKTTTTTNDNKIYDTFSAMIDTLPSQNMNWSTVKNELTKWLTTADLSNRLNVDFFNVLDEILHPVIPSATKSTANIFSEISKIGNKAKHKVKKFFGGKKVESSATETTGTAILPTSTAPSSTTLTTSTTATASVASSSITTGKRLISKDQALNIYRVVKYSNETEEKTRTAIINSYDKKMTTVVTCIEYDKALSSGDAVAIQATKEEMLKLIEESLTAYAATIRAAQDSLTDDAETIQANSDYKKRPEYYEHHLSKIKTDIDKNKDKVHLRELLEMSMIQLSMLRDRAYEVPINIWDSQRDSVGVVQQILDASFDNVIAFKMLCNDLTIGYIDENRILPIFSNNGANGFNTILFAIFNDYFPVGFSVKAHPVHARLYGDASTNTTVHDYGHALNRARQIKLKDPQTFECYRAVYYDIFDKMQQSAIDHDKFINFQKDLLILFFLVQEIGYAPTPTVASTSVASQIRDRTRLVSESDQRFLENLDNNDITQLLFGEMVDFITPLQKLGYDIPVKKEKLYESAGAVRKAFLEMLDGFSSRYPQVKLELEPAPKVVEKQVKAASSQANPDTTADYQPQMFQPATNNNTDMNNRNKPQTKPPSQN